MSITQGLTLPITQRDGKQIVIISPSTEGLNTWFHGAGDRSNPPQRGDGERYIVKFTDEEIGSTKEVVVQYAEPIELHDGQGIFTPLGVWDVEDSVNFFAELPATVVVVNPDRRGNCNLFPIPGGNLLVPAGGDGIYDVDLANAVPIESEDHTGYWDCEYTTGKVTPSETPAKAGYNLIDFRPEDQYFVVNLPCGHGHGILDVDTYKTQWIHQNYKIHLSVKKETPGAGKVAMWLLGFRKYISKKSK